MKLMHVIAAALFFALSAVAAVAAPSGHHGAGHPAAAAGEELCAHPQEQEVAARASPHVHSIHCPDCTPISCGPDFGAVAPVGRCGDQWRAASAPAPENDAGRERGKPGFDPPPPRT